jgi:hypothetical protein
MSAFILILLVITSIGWRWVSTHQTPGEALASHAVLALTGGAALLGLVVLWRDRRGV